jgi:hypothetical protein
VIDLFNLSICWLSPEVCKPLAKLDVLELYSLLGLIISYYNYSTCGDVDISVVRFFHINIFFSLLV